MLRSSCTVGIASLLSTTADWYNTAGTWCHRTSPCLKQGFFRIKIRSNRIKSYHSGLAINHRNRIFAYQIVSNVQQGLQFRIKHRLETD
jgi:hypothetical protein